MVTWSDIVSNETIERRTGLTMAELGLCRCGPPRSWGEDDQCSNCGLPLPDEAY